MSIGGQKVYQSGQVKTAAGVDQDKREATIAIAVTAVALACLGWVCGAVGVRIGPIGAAVMDKTSFGITGGGIAANLSTGWSIASTPFPLLALGRARPWLLSTGRLVTTFLH